MTDLESPFLWGVATSSHQVEGYNDKNDWWEWEAKGNIEGGAKSGPATDHLNRFREDIRLAAELGVTSYRFSVEWSRLEPAQGEFDSAAFDWYRELILECEKHGILPMLTLHHFTSPKWFAEAGGFTWEDSPLRFQLFTREVVRRLGSRIPIWCTFNEPMVLVAGTYLGKFMPPARYAPNLAAVACRNLLRAHVLAYDTIHSEIELREGPWAERPLEVGIAHNMLDFMPERPWHPVEQVLAYVFRQFYNLSWLNAVTGGKQNFGVLGLVPRPAPVREALRRKTADFIGLNYYTKAYIRWRPKHTGQQSPIEIPIGLSFSKRNDVTSDLEWAIHPRGFRKMLRIVSGYGLPIYVTENGIADRDDKVRSGFIYAHLAEIARGIENGIPIKGYYHWSLLDNFEWVKGFGPRFGLYQVNYEDFSRTPTASAFLYKKLISAHKTAPGELPQSAFLKT
jgi:beta-glucosidase